MGHLAAGRCGGKDGTARWLPVKFESKYQWADLVCLLRSFHQLAIFSALSDTAVTRHKEKKPKNIIQMYIPNASTPMISLFMS